MQEQFMFYMNDRVTNIFRMDIRKWLNKGTSQKFKDDLKASKKGRKALDSSDEETENENPKTNITKPVADKAKVAVSPKDFFKKKNKTPEKATKKRKASDDAEIVASTLTPVKKSKVETTKRKSPEVKESKKKIPKPELPKPVEKEKSLPNVKALEIKKSASEDAMDVDSAPKTPAEVRKANYLKFRAKVDAGPRNPGSKEIPTGAENCLEGLTFVATGNGESLGRDEMKNLIQRYGGKLTTSVSGKTSYLIVGDEAGESKIKKAKEKGVKMVDEDFVLELIKSKPAKKSKFEIQAEEEAAREARNTPKKKTKNSPRKELKSEVKEESKRFLYISVIIFI
jgi:replication factor C subunit 1